MPRYKYHDNDLRNVSNDDVVKYIPIVKSIINKRFQNCHLEYDEKLNAGLLGVAFGIKRYDPNRGKPLVAWIYYCASDNIRNEIRRTRKFKAALPLLEYARNHIIQDLQLEYVAIKDEFQLVKNNISCLDKRSRKVISYHFVDGLTFEDIAKKLGLSRQRVSQICKKALQKLREKISF